MGVGGAVEVFMPLAQGAQALNPSMKPIASPLTYSAEKPGSTMSIGAANFHKFDGE